MAIQINWFTGDEPQDDNEKDQQFPSCPPGFHWRWQDEPHLYGSERGYEKVRDVLRLR